MRSLHRLLPLALATFLPATAHAAVGGPDLGQYTWADSDEPGVDTSITPYSGTDYIALGLNGDESLLRVVLPTSVFPAGFPYYGQNYSAFWVSTNGWLSFVDPLGDPGQVADGFPSTSLPQATVGFLWDDWTLGPAANGGANTANNGYTLFLMLASKSDPNRIVQAYVTLFANGSIKMAYFGSTDMVMPSTSIGIENANGTWGLPYMSNGTPQNGAAFRDGYAVHYFPAGRLVCGASPTPLTCGQAATPYSNATGANNVSRYNCSSGTFDGFEKVFAINVAQASNLTFTLNNTDGRNRALFFLKTCSEFTGCMVGGSTVLQPKLVAPGNYLLVVDGVLATDNGSFTLQVDCQDAATRMPCNTTRLRDTTSGTGVLTNWSCAFGLAGPENIYQVDVTGPTTLRATLSNTNTADINLLVSDAAGFSVASPQCLVTDPVQATLWGARTGTYYVTVDSTAAATATYDLQVECSTKLRCPAPANVISLTPPTPVTGDTTGKPSNNDTYYCTSSAFGTGGVTNGYSGPEDVYEFDITVPSVVSFVFDPSNPDMRLLILKDCYEGSCVMEGGCGENLAPGRYRLVVDGLNGASGPYTLTPFVFPSVPYNRWYQCPEQGGPGQTQDSVRLQSWNFNSNNYCGTGCDFSLFAVVECGTEFHIPFSDVETGHMKIYDILQQRYIDLTAVNDATDPACRHISTGPYVQWEDSGCSAIPCPGGGCGGGADCKTNGRIMDVSFSGTPNVCGVYRVEFINWGGWAWQAFANCTGTGTPQFYLYRDMCSALANYHPLPEVGIANVTVDNSDCGSLTAKGTITIENVGCLPAANMEIIIDQVAPAPSNPLPVMVSLLKGQQSTYSWSYPITVPGVTLSFSVDPARKILECSENLGQTVSCGTSSSLQRTTSEPVCPASCSTGANAGQTRSICESEPLTVDGIGSSFNCVAGTPVFRWEDSSGTPVPGCDWSPTSTCNVPSVLLPAGPNVLTLKTQCLNDVPPCESVSAVLIDVIPNVTPPGLGNVLRAYRDTDTVRFSWASILGSPVSGYRLFKDGDRRLPLATRFLVGGIDLPASWTTSSDEGGVPLPPRPVAYYQIVGVSCFRDLEGPY